MADGLSWRQVSFSMAVFHLQMKIGLTGATGFIGKRVIQLAARAGHSIVGFSRNPKVAIPGCEESRLFDFGKPCDVNGCEAVIHLAGEPVTGLWTKEKKRKILESRTQGTKRIVDAIRAASPPPSVFVSGSAIGFYGDTGERETDESSEHGSGFLADVCVAWEREALRAREAGVRVVFLRTAVVLGCEGGALRAMLPAFKAGLGGKLGSGRQWMSWIHVEDEAAMALFPLMNADVEGAVNAASPLPCRNEEFTRTLARTLHRPAFLSVPSFALSALLGDFSHEVLDNKRVIPKRPAFHAFPYRFPTLEGALKDLLR